MSSAHHVTARATRAVRAPLAWVVAPAGRRRLALAGTVAGMLFLIAAGPAAAMSTDTPSPSNPWLAFFQPKDSHGYSPWQYELSVDQGGATSPGKAVAYFFASQVWMQYRFAVVAVMWLLDFVLQFKQLELLTTPAAAVSAVVQNVTGQIGVAPMMVTISVVISGVWLFRGRSGAAFGEILTTAVIAALIGGALANPVGVLTGPDGVLAQARDFGVGVSSQLVSGSDTTAQSPEQLRQAIDAKVLDNLVRMPHQLVNYGQVLDRTKPASCVTAYNKALGLTDDAGRNAVGAACGQETLDASDNTAAVQLGALIVGTAGGLFFVLVLALALALLVFTALALWEAAKFTVVLIKSLIPGSSRAAMLVSFCTAVICVGMCAVTLMSVGLLLLVLDAVFTATASWPPVTVFLIVDLMLLGGAIVAAVMVFRAKRNGRKAGERMSKALQPRPASLPSGGGFASAARQVAQPALQMRQTSQMRHDLVGASPTSPPRPQPPRPGGSPGSGPPSSPGVMRTVGKTVVSAGKIGLASTVGAPVYAPRAAAAAKQVVTARKAVMAAKLRDAGQNATARVTAARDDAAAFGHEYVHNVAAAGRAVGRATGVPRLLAAAAAGNPPLTNGPTTASASGGRETPAPPPARRPPRRSAPPTSVTPAQEKAPAPASRPASPSATTTRPTPPAASAVARPQTAAERLRARLDHR